jgi:hypothetical protein
MFGNALAHQTKGIVKNEKPQMNTVTEGKKNTY